MKSVYLSVFRGAMLCALLFVLGNEVCRAQQINLQVRIENKLEKDEAKKIIYQPVRFGYFNYKKASEIFKKLTDADPTSVHMLARKEGVVGTTASNGTYSFECPEGFGIIIITTNAEMMLLKVESQTNNRDKNGHVVTARKLPDGNYDIQVTISSNQLIGTTVKSDFKGGGSGSQPIDPENGFVYFKTHLEIISDFDEQDARIIIQPYVIDCQTDDTVACLLPFDFEGEHFHMLQDRRKAFDFFHKDSVGMVRTYQKEFPEFVYNDSTKQSKTNVIVKEVTDNGFKQYLGKARARKDTTLLKYYGDTIAIDTTIVFKRPISTRTYRCAFEYSLEDYHHKHWERREPGTCLRISPFKFLDFSVAVSELNLDEDFNEVPLSNKDSVKQDLGLQFKYATAELVDDPNYDSMLENLAVQMNKYADDLTDVNLVAYASPDGNEMTNKALARRRAEAALARIRIPNRNSVRTHINAVIDTWDETARLLEKEGHLEEAQAILDALEKTNHSNSAAEAIIKRLPTYQEVVKPVLESQCRIVFTYEFFAMHILTEDEAYEAYLKDKKRRFSPGDYFNIFKRLVEIGDSAGIDSLTLHAYDQIVKPDPSSYKRPFASYLINRKAIIDIKRGVPDSLILKDLINERVKVINWLNHDVDGLGTTVTFNRPEILLNQAIIFYQLQSLHRAKDCIDFIKRRGYSSENLQKLERLIDFKTLYPIQDELYKRPELQDSFERAKAFVENSSPDNKAILYTECSDFGMREYAWEYVHRMDDENPKKWYLMGILWSLRDGQEENFRPLDDYYSEFPELQHIPYYLAYFQHAFDIAPDMAKYYFNEGHISEKMRKKKWHAYKADRIPAYRELFKILKSFDDKEKEMWTNSKIVQNEDAEADTEIETNENTEETKGDEENK